jgi:hypothetical protein
MPDVASVTATQDKFTVPDPNTARSVGDDNVVWPGGVISEMKLEFALKVPLLLALSTALTRQYQVPSPVTVTGWEFVVGLYVVTPLAKVETLLTSTL